MEPHYIPNPGSDCLGKAKRPSPGAASSTISEVPPRRFLRYLNAAIGAALLVLLVCAWWYAWRPLPKISGAVYAPVAARAVASRDSLGVPHILATDLRDALFLQAYVTCEDRFFQMDAMRRMAAGELAEVVGPAALESDREARRLRMAKIAETWAKALPAGDRAALAAYARGVNYFLETNRGRLPLEFSLLRYDPRPWSIADSMLVLIEMVESQERSWRSEMRKENLLAGGDPAKVDFLFSTGTGGEGLSGSNAWAVSGALTASHQPLLAGDPHLRFTLPGAWYLVHIRAPRLNVTGASIPGLPGVIVGHNDRIAWSITNLQADTQDLYLERLDPATGRYAFRGQVEQARAEPGTIRVRGGPSETLVSWVTKHGPIFLAEAGRYYSLRWTAAESAGFQYPILDLDRAANWEEFRAAVARVAEPGLNFVYADTMGNIGYQAAGRIPIRKSFDGSVPVDGSSADFEWDGFIPFDRLPSVFNPSSGMIVSANQDPFPPGFPYFVNGDFAAPYRARQIADRLRSKQGWRAGEMLSIQTDTYSAFSRFLSREIVAACDRQRVSDPTVAAAVRMLRNWDGQMQAGKAAPLIATLAYQHLRTVIADRASPGKGLSYRYTASAARIEEIIRQRPKEWFQDYDQFLVNCLRDALEEGRRIQGSDVTKWDYGRYNVLVLDNPIVGRLPVVGKYFNVGPVAMSGSQETVQQFWREEGIGPSLRMVVDFTDLDRSLANITLGESGQVLSRHYRDQWDAYRSGRSFPMQFNKIDAKGTLVFLPEAGRGR